MSRLESMRRRLTAQIEGLNWAAQDIAGVEGDVLELGLGNGRTYDHMREQMPDRDIWVLDRVLQCHPSCVPPDAFFFLGEAVEIMPRMVERGIRLAMTHCDFGSGHKARDIEQGAVLSPYIKPLMVPGGLVVSQEPLVGFEQIAGPDTVDPERYLFYRT